MNGLTPFRSVARLTLLESVRQPLFPLLTAGSLVVISLFPILVTHVLSEGVRLIRDCALALYLVTGLVLGSLTAAHALSRDIRSGTAGVILSKPVGRVVFFLAKFSGVAAALLVYSALMTIAALLGTRTMTPDDYRFDWWGGGPLFLAVVLSFVAAGIQNYFTRCAFTSRAVAWLCVWMPLALALSMAVDRDGAWNGAGDALRWNILPAGLLVAFAILVLAALATALATRLDAIPVLTCCSAALLIGLISEYLSGQALSSGHAWMAEILDRIPNWQAFWLVDALNTNGIPSDYLLHTAGYTATLLAGLLAAGILSIQRLEVR